HQEGCLGRVVHVGRGAQPPPASRADGRGMALHQRLESGLVPVVEKASEQFGVWPGIVAEKRNDGAKHQVEPRGWHGPSWPGCPPALHPNSAAKRGIDFANLPTAPKGVNREAG